MSWVDLAIVVVLAASVLGGIVQGFLRSACSVIGLVLGIALAVWNYARLGMMFRPIVRMEAVANAHRVPDHRAGGDGVGKPRRHHVEEDDELDGTGLPGRDCRGNLWIFPGGVAGDAVYSGDRCVFSGGAMADAGQAAAVFCRGIAYEHAREPLGSLRQDARRVENARTRFATMDAALEPAHTPDAVRRRQQR